MAIDEKQIGEEMHTTLSNRQSGKIALLACSLKFQNLQNILNRAKPQCRSVQTLTRDLSPVYTKVGNERFFNSSSIADKFHIIRSLTESCQDVRVRYRQDILRERRLQYDKHKKRQKEKLQQCREKGIAFQKETFKYEEEKHSN